MLSFRSSLTALLAAASLTTASAYLNYTTVTGIFLQDNNATNATTFNFTASNFGLINRTYPSDSSCPKPASGELTQWQLLAHYISGLNKKAASNVQYRLFWFGRHGEGYHNAAESYYGTPAWNCYYSELDGNATVIWADAHLTPKGVQQAQIVNAFWAKEISEQKIPFPQKYYVSPLSRCLATAQLSFEGLDLPKKYPFVPEVKELFREGISGHTCDHRSSKTYIHEQFPTYTFEKGFVENDPLWVALHGETNVDQLIRSKKVLDQVYAELTKETEFVSVTSHSGEIGALLQVLGHRSFSLSTGAVIPVLVKAEKLEEPAPTTVTQAYTVLATCTSPPTITASTCNDCSCCTASAR